MQNLTARKSHLRVRLQPSCLFLVQILTCTHKKSLTNLPWIEAVKVSLLLVKYVILTKSGREIGHHPSGARICAATLHTEITKTNQCRPTCHMSPHTLPCNETRAVI